MGVEDEIASQLAVGATTQQLIDAGYKRSTIYKVAASLRVQQGAVPEALFTVDVDRGLDRRYRPGEVVQLAFAVTNRAPADLYVLEAGVEPEWLARDRQWVFTTQRQLLRPGQSLRVQVPLAIPNDIVLGEKDLTFAVRGQLVGSIHNSPPNELIWTEPPFVLRVQNPLTGTSAFLSHSVADLFVVRQLALALDNMGIEPIVAEEISTPGAPLAEKFTALIDRSSVLLALLTWQSVRSDWVRAEVDYAIRAGKPTILLRDQALASAETGFEHIEWTPIDLSHGVAAVASSMLTAIDRLRDTQQLLAKRTPQSKNDPLPVIMVAALGALVAGIAIGRSGGSSDATGAGRE